MGAPSTTQTMGFGRLIVDPSSSDSSTNYGGTLLGAFASASFRPRMRHQPRTSESRGGQVTDSLFLSQDAELWVVFQNFGAAALAASFYDTTDDLVKLPGAKESGSWVSDESSAILLAPDVTSGGVGFYLPRVVPLHDRLQIEFGGFLGVAFAMRFLVLPPSSGDLAQIGTVADMVGGWTS